MERRGSSVAGANESAIVRIFVEELRMFRVEAVHKFSIGIIVEGGLYGSSRKWSGNLTRCMEWQTHAKVQS